ncbi:MAG TPA: aldo/keto reductase [Chloroflexota bacterium]|nr:aldo/keto reductase [Chloroflexota bacterium]
MSLTPPDPTELRPYGATALRVTPICIGCAPLGNMPETFAYSVTEEDARATIRAFFASQINFLDTSAAYGDGEIERRIGLVIRELGGVPDGFVVATKADRDLTTLDFSGEQMRRSVDRSLRLLGLDQLEICYLHDPEHVTFEEIVKPGGALETLQALVEEGVIRHLGLAGGPIDLMLRYVELGCFEAVISHNRYTLLNRDADPLFDEASRRGMAVINAAPYGSGLLSRGPGASPRYMYGQASPEYLTEAKRLEAICARHDLPLAALALQFSLRDPRITSTIVGMSRPERLAQTIALARTTIPREVWDEAGA